jgi:hypothetical protein
MVSGCCTFSCSVQTVNVVLWEQAFLVCAPVPGSLSVEGTFFFDDVALGGHACTVSDDQLVAALLDRGQRHRPDGIQLVLLNACCTRGIGERLQRECGVPHVIAWADAVVPSKQCVVMVSTLCIQAPCCCKVLVHTYSLCPDGPAFFLHSALPSSA